MNEVELVPSRDKKAGEDCFGPLADKTRADVTIPTIPCYKCGAPSKGAVCTEMLPGPTCVMRARFWCVKCADGWVFQAHTDSLYPQWRVTKRHDGDYNLRRLSREEQIARVQNE